MKNYFNIETKKNYDGSYTGYDTTGRSWRISGSYGWWGASANVTKSGKINLILGCKTMEEMSNNLYEID